METLSNNNLHAKGIDYIAMTSEHAPRQSNVLDAYKKGFRFVFNGVQAAPAECLTVPPNILRLLEGPAG